MATRAFRTLTEPGYPSVKHVSWEYTSSPDKAGDSNIFGRAPGGSSSGLPAGAGPGRVYFLMVKNPGAELGFLKVYDSVLPSYGTTEPDYVFQITASLWILIPLELPNGVNFRTGLSLATATEAGATTDTDFAATPTVTIIGSDVVGN